MIAGVFWDVDKGGMIFLGKYKCCLPVQWFARWLQGWFGLLLGGCVVFLGKYEFCLPVR